MSSSHGRSEAQTRPSLLAAVTAECIGAYVLVFFGTGAVVALTRNGLPGAAPDLLGIALAFGLAVLVVIYGLGHVSGAHLNPAVTVALAVVRKFPLGAVPAYIGAQLAGAVLASLTVWALFGETAREAPLLLGATAPGDGVSAGTALLAEVVITFVLLLVVVGGTTDDRAVGSSVGMGVGMTITAGILATGSISGGSFNPARSLGPMLVSGSFPAWYVYIVGPVVGAVAAALLYDYVLRPGSPPEVRSSLQDFLEVEEDSIR